MGCSYEPKKNKHKLWLLRQQHWLWPARQQTITIRDSLLPRPSLKLDAAEANGHLMLRWNGRGTGIHQRSVVVDDGDEFRVFPLDGGQLNKGVMRYDRRVGAI